MMKLSLYYNYQEPGKCRATLALLPDLRIPRQAIQEHKLTSPAEIGAVLKAGTNCGSCVPELRKLLASSIP